MPKAPRKTTAPRQHPMITRSRGNVQNQASPPSDSSGPPATVLSSSSTASQPIAVAPQVLQTPLRQRLYPPPMTPGQHTESQANRWMTFTLQYNHLANEPATPTKKLPKGKGKASAVSRKKVSKDSKSSKDRASHAHILQDRRDVATRRLSQRESDPEGTEEYNADTEHDDMNTDDAESDSLHTPRNTHVRFQTPQAPRRGRSRNAPLRRTPSSPTAGPSRIQGSMQMPPIYESSETSGYETPASSFAHMSAVQSTSGSATQSTNPNTSEVQVANYLLTPGSSSDTVAGHDAAANNNNNNNNRGSGVGRHPVFRIDIDCLQPQFQPFPIGYPRNNGLRHAPTHRDFDSYEPSGGQGPFGPGGPAL